MSPKPDLVAKHAALVKEQAELRQLCVAEWTTMPACSGLPTAWPRSSEASPGGAAMPEQHRYGRFETWRLGVLWRAETADYFRTWAANGETEAEALANLAEQLLTALQEGYYE